MPINSETPGDAFRRFGRKPRPEPAEQVDASDFARRFGALDYLDKATVRSNACMVLAALADALARKESAIDSSGVRETAGLIAGLDLTGSLLPVPYGDTPAAELVPLIKDDVAMALGILADTMDAEGIPAITGAIIGRMSADTMEEIVLAVMVDRLSGIGGGVLDDLATLFAPDAGPGPEPGPDAARMGFEETEAEISKAMREMGL